MSIYVNSIVNHYRENPIMSFFCPYQDLSTIPMMIKHKYDLNFDYFNGCPSPLKGKRANVVTLGYPPYVLIRDDPSRKGGLLGKKSH